MLVVNNRTMAPENPIDISKTPDKDGRLFIDWRNAYNKLNIEQKGQAIKAIIESARENMEDLSNPPGTPHIDTDHGESF